MDTPAQAIRNTHAQNLRRLADRIEAGNPGDFLYAFSDPDGAIGHHGTIEFSLIAAGMMEYEAKQRFATLRRQSLGYAQANLPEPPK